ncbi:Rad2 nuclease [Dimargaris verticillata]|uniref:Rad2 nuclease n=1 Tax=Dimargaris verticillata TaxID=2761393 RepID=A0A9W8EA90_9FUNG|nr:Rad2 nuclease [Dimargaris verticillata]
MLRHHQVRPILVFDGGPLPSKKVTEDDRFARRQKSLATAMQHRRLGNAKEARDWFQRCVDITPEIALQFIQKLRQENVEFVVAPYEADAQLYYMEKSGLVDAVITEDSDLLAFGCKRVIFKLDRYGHGMEIRRSDFDQVREIAIQAWSDDTFRQMCILSGCDYLPSIPRVGLKTAHQFLAKHRDAQRAIQVIRLQGKYVVPPNYETSFTRAENTFLYQRVFDLKSKRLVTLNPIPPTLDSASLEYIGCSLDPEMAVGIAVGHINPITQRPFATAPALVIPINPLAPKQFVSPAAMQDPEKRSEKAAPFFHRKTRPAVVRSSQPQPRLTTFFAQSAAQTKDVAGSHTNLEQSASPRTQSIAVVPTETVSGYFQRSDTTSTTSSRCPSLTYSQETESTEELSTQPSAATSRSGSFDSWGVTPPTGAKQPPEANAYSVRLLPKSLTLGLPPYSLARSAATTTTLSPHQGCPQMTTASPPRLSPGRPTKRFRPHQF